MSSGSPHTNRRPGLDSVSLGRHLAKLTGSDQEILAAVRAMTRLLDAVGLD